MTAKGADLSVSDAVSFQATLSGIMGISDATDTSGAYVRAVSMLSKASDAEYGPCRGRDRCEVVRAIYSTVELRMAV
jgi:hypothetical protein